MKAICISGEYKSLEMGKIYEIEQLKTDGIFVKGGARMYVRTIFAYVDDDGKPIPNRYVLPLWRKEKKL